MLPAILPSRRRSCQPNIVEEVDHMFAECGAIPCHGASDRQRYRKQSGRAASRRFSRAFLCGCVQRCRRSPCSSQRAIVAPARHYAMDRARYSIQRKASGPLFIQRCKCAATMVMSKTAQAYHKQFVIHAMMLRHSITEPHGKASADHRHNRPMHGITDSCAPHPVIIVRAHQTNP